jgi:hypothetical protein
MRTTKLLSLSKGIIFAAGVICCLAYVGQKAVAQPQAEETIQRPAVDYSAQDLRDPFMLKAGGKATPKIGQGGERKPLPQLNVQGLIWGGKFPQAIINNKVVKVGDVLDNVEILEIDKDGVTVLFEGLQYDLSSPVAGPSPDNKP